MSGRKHPHRTPAHPHAAAERRPLLALLVATLSLPYVLMVVYVVVRRASYPFELEWLEGVSLEHVQRLRQGLPLYAAPSLAWVPLNYTPLYFWLGAAATLVFGESFLALRLVSATAALAAFALLWKLVRHETGRAGPAWLAVGLFAATFRLGGAWFDIARADSLHLALLLAGACVARIDRSRWRMPLVSGALFALAFLTKQSALLAAGPLVLWLAFTDRPRGFVIALTFAVLVVASVFALDATSGGWFHYYAFVVPRSHAPDPLQYAQFPLRDVGRHFAPLLALGALAVWATRRRNAEPIAFYGALALGFVLLGWSLRLYRGGYVNGLMPAHAALALLGALAFAALTRDDVRSRALEWLGAALVITQLALLHWNPSAQLPRPGDREAGERLVVDLRDLRGRVYVSSHTYLLGRAGRPSNAHLMPLMDVIRDGHGPRERALLASLRDSLAAQVWDQALLDNRDLLVDEFVAAGYRPVATLLLSSESLWPVTGMRTRPEFLFVSPAFAARLSQATP